MNMFVDKALDMDVEIKIDEKGGVCLDSGEGGDGFDGIGTGGSDGDARPGNDNFHMVKKELFGQEQSSTNNGTANSPGQSTTTMHKKRSFQQISQETIATPAKINSTNAISNNSANALGEMINLAQDETDRISEIAERLDSLMTLLCERIMHLTSFSPTSLSEAMAAVINARRLYRHLDGVFDKKVRNTDRSKFVQFVFFVLFGRENDALEAVGKLMAQREEEQQQQQLGAKEESANNTKDTVSAEVMTNVTEVKLDPDILPTTPINLTDPLYRGFSSKLIDLFFNPTYAGDLPRQTVVCYLASFVSRATYVCPETVCECVAALLRWAEVYIDAQSGGGSTCKSGGANGAGSLRRSLSTAGQGNTQHPCEIHALFYTACQAAFYIMCFRGAEAIKYYRAALCHMDDPESPYAHIESVDIGPERWKFLCGHAMQPLKYCLESVRVEFLHLAGDLHMFLDRTATGDEDNEAKQEEEKFLQNLWHTTTKKQSRRTPHGPKNRPAFTPARRRSTIISTSAMQEKKRMDGGVGGLGRGSNPLDSFFPFDPYLLEKSFNHVQPYYRNWEDCILVIEEDGDTPMKTAEDEALDALEHSMLEDETADHSDADDDDGDEEHEDDHSSDHGEDNDGDEDDDDDEDDDEGYNEEDGEEQRKASKSQTPGFVSLHEDATFELEIRRSRAMSTGSQCSW